MALTKARKNEIIDEISELLDSSKMTVVAEYKGTPVKALQQLRRKARDNGTKLKVIKNRLVIRAIQSNNELKDINTEILNGMLLYAFNAEDEVLPAKILAEFAKEHPSIEFKGAFSSDGKLLEADEVKSLASLPGKEAIISQLISMLSSPLNDIANGLSGNLHGILDGVELKVSES